MRIKRHRDGKHVPSCWLMPRIWSMLAVIISYCCINECMIDIETTGKKNKTGGKESPLLTLPIFLLVIINIPG